jgi:hypothetical protein
MVAQSADSETSIKLANEWIKQCFENHPRCPGKDDELIARFERLGVQDDKVKETFAPAVFRDFYPKGRRYLPTRLIDVGPPDDAKKPRLCLGQDVGEDKRYITLSHCWGEDTSGILKTTRATIDERLLGFEMESLPQNFRDAIVMTRKLKVRYLWIDSLCIIQDSKEDWEQESATMGEVYSNCYCTLAATASKDSSAGLFSPRDSNMISPCVLTFSSDTGLSEKIIIHPPYPIGSTMEEFSLKNEPLLCRAWTMQERDLSPRTIHFASKQLMWECRSQKATEADPSVAFGTSFMFPLNGASHFVNALTAGSNNYMTHWYALVRDYSDRAITYPLDKLPALSGLAKKFQELTGDVYLAGIWKEDLVRGLCWQTQSLSYDSSRETDEEEYRSPSWSWASSNYPLHWPYEILNADLTKINEIIRIQDALVHPSGRDITGKVSNGYLKVIGFARMIHSRETDPWCLRGDPLYYRESVRTFTIFNGPISLSDEVGTMVMDRGFDIGQRDSIVLLKILEEKPNGGKKYGDVIALVLAPPKNVPSGIDHMGGKYGGEGSKRSLLRSVCCFSDTEKSPDSDRLVLRRVGIARVYALYRRLLDVPPSEITLI